MTATDQRDTDRSDSGSGKQPDCPPVEHCVLDLDGTVYRGGELIAGAGEAVEAMRDAGVAVTFLTNNAATGTDRIAEKLSGFGVPARPAEVVTSGTTTAVHLSTEHPDCTLFVVGEQPFRETLLGAQLELTDTPERADGIVVSLDREFDYDTLGAALRVFQSGDPLYIATNPDPTRPGERHPQPSTGGIIGAIEGTAGREPDRITGKPSGVAAAALAQERGLDPERTVVVGDRVETDIRFGNTLAARTILVLSGVTDRAESVSAVGRADHVLGSLADVPTVLPGV